MLPSRLRGAHNSVGYLSFAKLEPRLAIWLLFCRGVGWQAEEGQELQVPMLAVEAV
jgi:hypothetical protein